MIDTIPISIHYSSPPGRSNLGLWRLPSSTTIRSSFLALRSRDYRQDYNTPTCFLSVVSCYWALAALAVYLDQIQKFIPIDHERIANHSFWSLVFSILILSIIAYIFGLEPGEYSYHSYHLIVFGHMVLMRWPARVLDELWYADVPDDAKARDNMLHLLLAYVIWAEYQYWWNGVSAIIDEFIKLSFN